MCMPLMLTRRDVLRLLTTLPIVCSARPPTCFAVQSPTQIRPDEVIFRPPDNPTEWSAFHATLVAWRAAKRKELRYDGLRYSDPASSWGSKSYASGLVMLFDQALYDHTTNTFLIDDFLTDGIKDFGGFDNLILWHAYPRIGFDDRNQFDFYRDLPNGLEGVRALINCCHARNVRVMLPYQPWDTGTRRENKSDVDTLCDMILATGADGIYLDTMAMAPSGLRTALDKTSPGLLLEGEADLPLHHVHDHHMSWAQNVPDQAGLGILRNKWFEPRHMQHLVSRWQQDHTNELHRAWLNGSGMVIWENVFGSRRDWNPENKQLLSSMLPILRQYSTLFASEGWTPLAQTEHPDLIASLWEGRDVKLWTLLNKSTRPISGPLVTTRATPHLRSYDLLSGKEIPCSGRDQFEVLTGNIEGRGIAALLAIDETRATKDDASFLLSQQQRHNKIGTSDIKKSVAHTASTTDRRKLYPSPPSDMVAIGATETDIRIEFRVRECGFDGGEWEKTVIPDRMHAIHSITRRTRLSPYAIDLMPVTNDDFFRFLRSSGYRPTHTYNFLRHWRNGRPTPEQRKHPVVNVDLQDAREYAKWVGKRLPTEEEWQYAAQGLDALRYPWGNLMLPSRCNGGGHGETTPVDAFPDGRSPFGCFDMCGNTWEWTESERSDGRTRFCFVRGGSYYEAMGSHWYADGGPQPNCFSAKFVLMWPGLDRCKTIGFRCVVDLR